MVDVENNCSTTEFKGHPDITQLSFHPLESRLFAMGRRGGEIELHDHGEWSVLRTDQARRKAAAQKCTSLEFCSNEQESLLIAGNDVGQVQVWDYKKREWVFTFEVDQRWVKVIARFHPLQPYIMCASDDGTIKVYSKSDYKLECGHPIGVRRLHSMAPYKDSNRFVIGGKGTFLIIEAYEPDPHPAKKVKIERPSEQGTEDTAVVHKRKWGTSVKKIRSLAAGIIDLTLARAAPSGPKHEKTQVRMDGEGIQPVEIDGFSLRETAKVLGEASEHSDSEYDENHSEADESDGLEAIPIPMLARRFVRSQSNCREDQIMDGERVSKLTHTGKALKKGCDQSQSQHGSQEQIQAERIEKLEREVSDLVEKEQALKARCEQCESEKKRNDQMHAETTKQLLATGRGSKVRQMTVENMTLNEALEKSKAEIQQLNARLNNLMEEKRALEERYKESKVDVQDLECRFERYRSARDTSEKSLGLRAAPNQKDHVDQFWEFAAEELQAATNSFDDSCKLEERRHGVFYVGKIAAVMIKQLKVGNKMSCNQDAKLTREMMNRLTSLRHPHLQTFLGVCYANNCLVYEHMANGSVKDSIISCAKGGSTRKSLSWDVRLRVIAQVAHALFFLHSNQSVAGGPIIHRGINPENILLDANFVAKIGEVDAALLAPERAPKMCMSAGTTGLQYLAPEFCQSNGTLSDQKTDIYSFGVTVLEILSGNFTDAVRTIENALEDASTFPSALDTKAGDWDVDLALQVAQLGLRCSSLDGRNRPSMMKGEGAILPLLEDIASKVEVSDPLEAA
ncbi:hypothetical protein CBR_g36753 [Chara braunii]|uniref:Protein kinase domain-containing protein n=1 Tax=Chara braunii TaxID=69332 RepID=A0A388LLN3_CHABU|nr:hypothetical protein CBR_g36753 [Chara braunii]|eukprot:GBG83135.1 hypothetical protein CBR_g36753 [Chara braunii]